MFIVGLTGAHGVGKTTLCRELQRRLTKRGFSVSTTPEVPREILAEAKDPHFFRQGNNKLSRQFLIIARQILVDQKALGVDVELCDRTLLDHWCYTLALFDDFDDPLTRSIWSRFVMTYQRRYQLLLYLPIEVLPLDDGVREGDVEFQRKIDILITKYLKEENFAFHIIRGSVAQRADHCESLILARLRNPAET